MKYLIQYEHSGNEHAPDWLSLELEADSEDEARNKFDALGYYAAEVVIKKANDESLPKTGI